jgi:fucose permease
MHVHFGQRGIALTGPLCHLVAYTVVAVHPPYPVLVVMFIFVGFGNGLIDAAWCAWIGNMANANEVSGFLQACYSLGATISPLIATAMVENGGLTWYTFYYIMVRLVLYFIQLLILIHTRSPAQSLSFLLHHSLSGNRPVRCTKPRIHASPARKQDEPVRL